VDTVHAGAPALRLELEEDVASLVFDRPGSRANFLSHAGLETLDACLAEAGRLAGEGRLRALVLRSARPGVFVAGVDLDELRSVRDAAEGAAHARRGQAVLRRLEQLAVPTFAAVDGACLGAGAELALACSYRLASASPRTRIGFPEVRLGLVPALGGTVRLPRLIGVRDALGLIVTGSSVDAREAERLGLVDAVLPAEDFGAAVRRFVAERLLRGRQRTGARRGVARRLVEDTAPGRRVVFARMRRELARAGAGSPAARRALEVVADGLALPLDRAFEREAEALGELLASREARGLLHAFALRQAARGEDAAEAAAGIQRAAVLGAGRTGTGVAYLLAAAGIPVRLRETRHAALLAGLERLRALFREGVRQDRLPAAEAEERMPAVVGTLGFGGFGTVDVVLEAVPDDEERRRAVLREAEEHVRGGCLLVTTGAAARVSRVQEGCARPEQVVGMRFAAPVAWGSLVEVVRGDATSDAAAAAAAALARRLGRTPLPVRDSPGFLVGRLQLRLVDEALRLVEEGAAVARVDGAMTAFGMAMGPLRLADELGIARVARLSRFLAAELGERMRPTPLLAALAGRKRGRGAGGFALFRHGRDGTARLSPEAAEALRGVARPGGGEFAPAEMSSRMLLALVNEAAHALEEGVVATAAEVDLATLLGLGFPATEGGLLFYADRMGIAAVHAGLEELARHTGGRFRPAPLVQRLAGEGRGFHEAAEAASAPAEAVLLDMPADG
jgi:3-hydroxyacyl-CoA dehydrogenase/enoyl-CoA hydratase/3-hydroxybutyryl-CoA epimerase